MSEQDAIPWRRSLGWVAAAAAVFATVQVGARAFPGQLDAYGSFVSAWVVRPLSLVTGAFPFSVGEVASGAYIAWLLFRAGSGVVAVVRRRLAPGRALAAGVTRLAGHAGVLFLVFTLLWGFHYARPGLEERYGWPEWSGVDAGELAALAAGVVEATNQAYLDLHGSEDLGRPTTVDDWAALETALDRAWAQEGPGLLGEAGAEARRGGGKRPLISPAFRRLGISGMYFPFAAEAWVTRDLPAVVLPNTLAHEKAHQRGVAGEAEAGFVAVMVGSAAEHPLARYSAATYAQLQLMGALARADRETWRALALTRLPGVQRDLEDLAAYWSAYQGPARQVSRATNDAYLRAHGVKAGVADYGRTVNLLVAWARMHGGRVLPE